MSSDRLTGKAKWFDTTRGFGFITPDDGSDDIFVHQSSIKCDGFRSLIDGEEVEYQTETGDDGRLKAVDVTGPGGNPVQGSRSSSRRVYYSCGGAYGGRKCYKCGEMGHMARECPQGGGGGDGDRGGGSGVTCYNCGGSGHYSTECGEMGHMARECPQGGRGGDGDRGGGGGGSCYNSGGSGHFARECPNSGGRYIVAKDYFCSLESVCLCEMCDDLFRL